MSTIEIQAADSMPRVQGIAYTGGKLDLPGWKLPVVVDLSGLEMADRVPLLADHENRTSSKLGTVEAEVEDHQLLIDGQITATGDTADRIVSQGQRDAWDLSVGIKPKKTRRVTDGADVNGRHIEGRFYLVKAGVLKEISVLPIGADSDTHLKIAARFHLSDSEEDIMDEDDEVTEEDVQAEQERIDEIKAEAEDFPELASKAIESGWSPERVEVEVLRRKSANLQPSTGGDGGPPTEDRLEAALALRAGVDTEAAERMFDERALQAGEDLGAAHAMDLVRAAFRAEGIQAPRNPRQMVKAAFSTTSLPKALGSVGEKVLLDAYRTAPAAWRGVAKRVNLQNFHEHDVIRPSYLSATAEELADGGEIKHASMDETTATIQGATYARMLTITRTQVVNDNLGVFRDTAEVLGRGCLRKLNQLFAQVVQDTAADLSGTAEADLAHDGLKEAIRLLRTKTDSDGNILGLQPRNLIVPAALEDTGRQLLNSTEVNRSNDQAPTGNTLQNMADLVVMPRLDSDSQKQWLLTAGPADAPYAVGFLDGRERPHFETLGLDQDANRLAYSFRTYHDFAAAGPIDDKAVVKSDGTTS